MIGLEDADLDVSVVDGAFTIRQQLAHIHDLVSHVSSLVGKPARENPHADIEPIYAVIAQAINGLRSIDDAALTDFTVRGGEDIMFAINGPLADALTHIGQINICKRKLGRQAPTAGYYRGEAPH